MKWHSALLVFRWNSPADPAFEKMLESVVVFRAKDFPGAHQIAKEIGARRAQDETLTDDSGSVSLMVTYCHVRNLDLVGSKIDGREVWSKLSDTPIPIVPEPDHKPSQTI